MATNPNCDPTNFRHPHQHAGGEPDVTPVSVKEDAQDADERAGLYLELELDAIADNPTFHGLFGD